MRPSYFMKNHARTTTATKVAITPSETTMGSPPSVTRTFANAIRKYEGMAKLPSALRAKAVTRKASSALP